MFFSRLLGTSNELLAFIRKNPVFEFSELSLYLFEHYSVADENFYIRLERYHLHIFAANSSFLERILELGSKNPSVQT